jgi:hypothetical protein
VPLVPLAAILWEEGEESRTGNDEVWMLDTLSRECSTTPPASAPSESESSGKIGAGSRAGWRRRCGVSGALAPASG